MTFMLCVIYVISLFFAFTMKKNHFIKENQNNCLTIWSKSIARSRECIIFEYRKNKADFPEACLSKLLSAYFNFSWFPLDTIYEVSQSLRWNRVKLCHLNFWPRNAIKTITMALNKWMDLILKCFQCIRDTVYPVKRISRIKFQV